MNLVYLGITIFFVLVLLIVIMRALGNNKGDDPESEWEHLGVEHCGSVCPNSGACDGCDIGFP